MSAEFEKCQDCRGWIKTSHTDYMRVKQVDGSEGYLHMRPCYQRFAESNEHEVIERVLTAKQRKSASCA